MTTTALLTHIARDDRRRARIAAGSVMARYAQPGDISYVGASTFPHQAVVKPRGVSIPEGVVVIANRLDAAQAAMHVGDDRDGDTVPGYAALEEARDDALDRLAETRAETLIGLQAKAKALLTCSVADVGGWQADAITASLARNLLGIPRSAITPRPDPILAVIEESRRLDAIHGAALTASSSRPTGDPSHEPERAAYDALWSHWDGVLLKTVPTTGRGCQALARYAVEFLTAQGIEEHRDAILSLIARSPLL